MENEEKRPRRPRIGFSRQGLNNRENPAQGNYEQRDYSQQRIASSEDNKEQDSDAQQQSFQSQQPQERRYYQNDNAGGYRQNNGGYRQNGGGYRNNNGGYQQRGGYRNNNGGGYRQNGGYNNGGGYRNNNGYNNGGAQSDGNYNNDNDNGYRQNNGGYRQNNGGGYHQNNGGYRQNNGGGYRQNNGGYRQNNNGGYRQNNGGYRNNNGGGYQQRGQQQRPKPGRTFTPRPKQVEYEMPIPDPNEQVRLNKFMANAGICSRREADEYIQQGLIKVNGNVVTELGTKISPVDVVEFKDEVVTLQSKCYILLNKPKDCVTTSDDPNGRTTVMDLVKGACKERIYPVGRLDRNTTGVLLLTNDGDLASKLTHPKYVKKKIYHVWCDKDISEDDMQRIADGIELEDGPIHADAISYATETDKNQAGIEIHSGRNRIVRRIFEALGYRVTKLDRVYFAGLTKKNLPRGRWRYLTQDEVNYLKMGSFE